MLRVTPCTTRTDQLFPYTTLVRSDRPQRAARDAAGGGTGRGGADEGLVVPGQLLHPRLVAEDRSAAALRGRIDGEHRDAMALVDDVQAEGFDEGRFADSRNAGNADADCIAGLRQQSLEQRIGFRPMPGSASFEAPQSST